MAALVQVIAGSEEPAERSVDAQNREVVARDNFPCYPFRPSAEPQTHLYLAKTEHALKAQVVISKVLVYRIREPVPPLIASVVPADRAEHDQLIRVIRKR